MNANIAPRTRYVRRSLRVVSPAQLSVSGVGKTQLPGATRYLVVLLLLAMVYFLLSTPVGASQSFGFVPVLQTTFTNPIPSASDRFGFALAVLDSDHVLIGAPGDTNNGGRGGAYMFGLGGTLLATFHTSAQWNFGWSITTLQSNYIYIGAEYGPYTMDNNGILFSFNTNGSPGFRFWNTNTSPRDPQDKFSASVAALGNGRLIVGAYDSDTGSGVAPDNGAVFLFDIREQKSTPLAIITNPFPNPYQPSPLPPPPTSPRFGWSVAAVGDDQILIGAPYSGLSPGKAYLFSTNGLLLTSFTNRSGARGFGYSLAALGSDRILIGAPFAGLGASRGRALLFSTNGTLLATFVVPPNSSAFRFGNSVTAVGSDRILIGAPGSSSTNAGAAFLFSTNGTLLATYEDPRQATYGFFGATVVTVGNDRVMIGDPSGPTGGVAYLFSLFPSLDIQSTPTNTLKIAWSMFAQDVTLQQNTNGIATANWSNMSDIVYNDGTNNYIIVDPASSCRFYRLVKH